jgi:glycosyltransferase involved in cell wall biosynthesis
VRIGVLGPVSLELLRRRRPGLPGDLAPGTAGSVVATLVEGLLDDGHEVVVFSLSRRTDTGVREARSLTVHDIPERPDRRARDLFAVERQGLLEAVRAHPVDVLHAHWSYEYALAALASGRPTLVTLHDHAPTIARYQPDMHRAVRLLMNTAVVRRAPHLTVTSPYLLRRLTPAARRKAVVIPNMFAPPAPELLAATGPPAPELLAAAGPAEPRPDGPVVVSVLNGYGRRKNADTALAALHLLRRGEPTARLVLLGDGMQAGGPAEAYAREHGLQEGVDFVGSVPYDDSLARIAAADALLHPAREEAFGMAVLEAMALGTPVVGGIHSGNVPDLLGGGRFGVLCDVEDPVDMAAALAGLLQEPDAARALAARARRRAAAFTPAAVIPRYVQAYHDVLAAAPLTRGD